jgi:hypothetical protein
MSDHHEQYYEHQDQDQDLDEHQPHAAVPNLGMHHNEPHLMPSDKQMLPETLPPLQSVVSKPEGQFEVCNYESHV